MRVVVLLLLLTGCAPDGVVDGRPYSLQVPSDSDSETPLPLVILLHGFSATGSLQEFSFRLSQHVETRKFLYALPNGTLDPKGRRFWNAAGACCQPPDAKDSVDDVAFLRAVVEDVRRRHPVSKVFFIGHSNGGFMALRMACDASDVVDGIVSVAGALADEEVVCTDGTPVAVLQLHGTADKVIKYGGGATDYGSYSSAAVTVDKLASRNGCSVGRTEQETIDIEAVDGAETRREAFEGCPAGGLVELWSMDGVGHLPSFKDEWGARAFDWLVEHAR